MAPEAHGAQVLPDPDFGPKNMIRPPGRSLDSYIHTYIHTDRQLDKYILDTLEWVPLKLQEQNLTVI